jgi:hypothetical protein
MKIGIVDETEEWLPIGGLEPGFDEYKLPATDEIAGMELKFSFDVDGSITNYLFRNADSLTWEVLEGPEKGTSGQETYEAIRVAPDIYFVDFLKKSKPGQSLNIALDLGARKATLVVGTLVQEQGGPYRVKQDFLHAAINPSSPDEKVIPHERSTDLVGKRVKYTYSSTHAYEHVYLNDHRYTWHCLSGPEKGLADTEHCDCFKIAPDVYLFTWWERVVPCEAVVMINLQEMRSTGKLFGLDTDSGKMINFTMGSYAKLLNVTTY